MICGLRTVKGVCVGNITWPPNLSSKNLWPLPRCLLCGQQCQPNGSEWVDGPPPPPGSPIFVSPYPLRRAVVHLVVSQRRGTTGTNTGFPRGPMPTACSASRPLTATARCHHHIPAGVRTVFGSFFGRLVACQYFLYLYESCLKYNTSEQNARVFPKS